MPGVGKKADAVADRSGVPLLYNHVCLYRSLPPPGGKGGTPFPALVPGAGTLPVGFQGRSALVAPKGAKSPMRTGARRIIHSERLEPYSEAVLSTHA